MTIDFTCQKCEASFELASKDLLNGTEKLICPHCETKAPTNLVEDFNAALTEMLAQVAALAKKFSVNMAFETDDVEEVLEDDDDDEDDDAEDLDEDDDDDDVDDDDDDLEDEDTEGEP